jgi:sugar phosphate isomerase/epimerase
LTNFRLAIETTLFDRMPLREALKTASSCGFGMIEIGLTHFDACSSKGADVEALGELLSRDGLGIAALFALPGWDPFKRTKSSLGISSPDESKRRKAVEQMRHSLDVARQLGCRSLASELSGDMDDQRASRRSFVKSVAELLPELEDDGSTIFFEAHPGDFIQDSFAAVELLASFDSERIRYNYCVPHTFNLGHSPSEIVQNARGLLGYVHFADTLMPSRIFFSPLHPPKVAPHLHMIPGQGDVDMEEVLSSLAREGFDGYLAVQPFSSADQPVRAAKRAKAVLIRLLAGLDHGMAYGG